MTRVANSTFRIEDQFYQSMVRYIESLWRYGPSKLLVIRLDFGSRQELSSTISCDQIKSYFERFKKNMRHNVIFNHQLGNCWSLEFAPDKGYHYHCLFIFDGNQVQNDVYRADQIGQYWLENVTRGVGVYWNCNRYTKNYIHHGIGMIDYRDSVKREVLLTHVLPYLAKQDHLIRSAIQRDNIALETFHGISKVRTYGVSHPLTKRRSPAGRPRSTSQPPQA